MSAPARIRALFRMSASLLFAVVAGAVLGGHEALAQEDFRSLDQGRPLKVTDVCLTFVRVRTPEGKHEVLELRLVELAKLDRGFAHRTVAGLRRGTTKK